MSTLQKQIKTAVKEYVANIEVQFSDNLVNRVVDHIEKEYDLEDITQVDLAEFLDSDAIGDSVHHFWNEYLHEDNA